MKSSFRNSSTTALLASLFLCMTVLLGACSQEEVPDSRPATADTTDSVVQQAPPPGPSSLPQSKEGTIMIEGTSEPIRLELFDAAPYSMPLLFTTYIPSDMIGEQVPDAEGPAVRFVSNFNGTRNADAFLQVGFLPAGTTSEQARDAARALATGSGRTARVTEGKAFDWSLAEHTYTGAKGAVGRVVLGRHGDIFFHTRTEHPPEFGDGFGPRVGIIFDEWKWSDATTPGIAAGSGQSGQAPAPAADTGSVTGRILRIDKGEGDKLGSLFLEQAGMSDTASNKAVVIVAPSTRIFRQESTGRRRAEFTDIKAGMTIRATFSGPILMIYPMRITAEEIVIWDDEWRAAPAR